ncbi:MAG: hypothetical protein ACOY3X_04390 [Pseudomonadota bacterium]
MGTSVPPGLFRGARAIRAITIAVVGLLAPLSPAHAADTDAVRALGALYSVARQMDAAVLDLNMLLGEDQSPAYKTRLDATLKSLEEAQKASAAALGTAGVDGARAGGIATNINGFIKLMRENRKTIAATGVPENAVVDDMMLHRKEARKIIDPLYTELEKRAGLTDSPLSEARALALVLQQMSALYVETASAAYGVSNRTQDASEATIDSLARSFASRLNKLSARAKGTESATLVHGIESKWRFIEKSMLNYRERTVPFLVDRYTQAIVTDLLKLAEALERGA